MPVQWHNTEARYGAVAQAFHWLVAAGVLWQFALGWYMTDLPNTPAKLELYNLHKSTGLTVLGLAVLRLAWRAWSPAPPLPAGRPAWERRAARASHALLYALLFAQPLSGLTLALAAEFPSVIYGAFVLPDPLGHREGLEAAMRATHVYLADAMAVLVLVHAGAALRHHLLLRDDVLRRMLPGAARRTAEGRR